MRGEAKRFAGRRGEIGVGPGFFADQEGGGIAQAPGDDEALESGEPRMIVARAVIGLATIGRGAEFAGERGCPLFPGEVALLGKFDGKGEGLRLPRLGENRSTGVARKFRHSGEVLGIANQIRLAQGSHPTYREKRNRGTKLARPKARARRSARSKHAAASRRENARWYPEKRKRRGLD